jgi:hypothetical protein
MNPETRAIIDLLRSGPYRTHAEARKHAKEMLLADGPADEAWNIYEARDTVADLTLARVDWAEVMLATNSAGAMERFVAPTV